MKKKFKKLWLVGSIELFLVIFLIVANIIVPTMLDNVAEQFFGSTPDYLVGNTKD